MDEAPTTDTMSGSRCMHPIKLCAEPCRGTGASGTRCAMVSGQAQPPILPTLGRASRSCCMRQVALPLVLPTGSQLTISRSLATTLRR